MTRRKTPKKTETLEVRLPHAVKRAFMARARARGRTASSLVREYIDSYLAGTEPRSERRRMIKRIATPAAVTSVLAAAISLHLVAPTAASAAPDLRALFDQLDADNDGRISAEEFVARDRDQLAVLHDNYARSGGGAMPLMIALHAGAFHVPDGPLPASSSPDAQRP